MSKYWNELLRHWRSGLAYMKLQCYKKEHVIITLHCIQWNITMYSNRKLLKGLVHAVTKGVKLDLFCCERQVGKLYQNGAMLPSATTQEDSPTATRKPSWRKGKRATAVRVWRPIAKKSTANFQLMVNSNRGSITYGLRIAIYFRVVENRHFHPRYCDYRPPSGGTPSNIST